MNAPTQYLTFSMGGEEYAIELLSVREILEFGAVTAVPKAPRWLCGVINLRGSVVPVVDLAAKLDLPESPFTRRTCIIIVETNIDGEDLVVGLMAEAVNQVIDLDRASILAPPSYGTAVSNEFLVGMAQSDTKFTLLLDIDGVLTRNDAAAITAAPEDVAEGGGESIDETVPPEPDAAAESLSA